MIEKHFTVIDSTNQYLKDNYQSLGNETFVSADKQTNGKGRGSRSWISDDNNLLFSILLKDEQYYKHYADLSIVTAYSVVTVLEKIGIKDVSIKWPNDVFIKDKKVCGILLEAVTMTKMECLIIGVGINVNQETFDETFNIKATSLFNQTNKKIDINTLKQEVYQTLLINYDKVKKGYNFYKEIKQYDYLKDKKAYALINNEKRLIIVKGINPDYSIKVSDNNMEYDVNSGEISFHI